MTDRPQYPTGRQITDADLLAALMPDTAAGAAPAPAAPAAPAPAPQFDVAALLELARRQGALEAAVTQTAPAAETSASILPRWAVGTAVASVGIGAGACLLGWALDLLATGAAAVAAGITAAAPMLLIGAVLVVALLARRSKGGGIEVTQTITQTITQSVKGGGRR
ncbi:spdB1 [Streptomyces laurentii]|uniref:SpdB1 n=1 Tax=Streptomyces laurentii TaxID=39478 RepID=A0A160P0G1_STRLU|nr:spdB1 [Streptomyces laurentii]